MCPKKILRIVIMKDKNVSIFFPSSFSTYHHKYIQARMFFKQSAFVCCVRNKYYCAITKFAAYFLPIKERLMRPFFFPLSVCVFFFFTFPVLAFIFSFYVSICLFLLVLMKISPGKRKFPFISIFFSFWAFFFFIVDQNFPRSVKISPEPRSRVRTFSAPLV